MTREKINKIFDWLEENMNYKCLLEFRLGANNTIRALWKKDNSEFAEFYISRLLMILEDSDVK